MDKTNDPDKTRTEPDVIDPVQSYDQIIRALKLGHKVELCSINQHGRESGEWFPVSDKDDITAFPVERYRIIKSPAP